jgi:hypothetical protein
MGNFLITNMQNFNQTQITDENKLDINFRYLQSKFSENIILRINDKSNIELKNMFDLFQLLNLENYIEQRKLIYIDYKKNYIKIKYITDRFRNNIKLIYDIRQNSQNFKKYCDSVDTGIDDYNKELFFPIMCLINIVQIKNNLFCDKVESECFFKFLEKCKKVKIPNEILKIMKECFTNLISKNQNDLDIVNKLIEDNNIKINDNDKIINEKKILLENITNNIQELQNQIKNLTDSTQKIKIIEYKNLSGQLDLLNGEIDKINMENKKILGEIYFKNQNFKHIDDNLLNLKKALEIIDFSIIINESGTAKLTHDDLLFYQFIPV